MIFKEEGMMFVGIFFFRKGIIVYLEDKSICLNFKVKIFSIFIF